MIVTDGQDVLAFGPSAYRAYTAREQSVLRAALGAWPGDEGVAEAAAVVEAAHIELLQGLTGAELIGFHGQTLAHDPSGRGTHQAGDGAALAEALGIPVVWDLRSADVAAGGQGAPLAPAYHFALARAIGADQPVSFLNLGGVGNLTWIDPNQPAAPETSRGPPDCLRHRARQRADRRSDPGAHWCGPRRRRRAGQCRNR